MSFDYFKEEWDPNLEVADDYTEDGEPIYIPEEECEEDYPEEDFDDTEEEY